MLAKKLSTGMKKMKKDYNISKKRKDSESLLSKIRKKEEERRLKENNELNVLSKITLNRRLIMTMVLFVGLFMGLALYMVYFQLFKSNKIENHSHNRRLWVDEDKVHRGSIYDRNENVLAYSDYDENGSQYRVYNYGRAAASVTGYNSKTYGKSGIEKSYNKFLLALSEDSQSKFRKMVINNDTGYDLHLSIDQNIQNIVYKYMENIVGACVIMDPRTGEVLSLVSNPTFDPNTIDEDWDSIIQNNDGSLVNRATNGGYRPGSTFKIVTATGILENDIDETYQDTGSEEIQGYEIKNYADQVYGFLDLRSAFVNSVNTYFANKTDVLGKDKYESLAERFMINRDYNFDLDKLNSIIPFDELNRVDTAMTGFGYGKSQITPLHMAMITSAIANEGKMMAPRLVNKIVDKEGNIVKENKDKLLSEVTSADNAKAIRDMMVEVVTKGTGINAYLDYLQIAGKTGTADKEGDLVDAWFVGFAPAYDPKLTISLVVEDSEGTGGEVAAPLAKNILDEIYMNVDLD